MMILTIICLYWTYQTPVDEDAVIWREIASLEAFIHDTVRENDSQFMTAKSDPIRGYYVEHRGVLLLVPIRYIPNRGVIAKPTPKVSEQEGNLGGDSQKLTRVDIQERYDEWKTNLRKSQLAKEANFNRAVGNLKNAIPRVLEILTSLPENESLTIIVEERVAWYYPGFSLEQSPTIKVVTLSADKSMISDVHEDKVILKKDWKKRVKSKTTNRTFYSLVP